MLELDEERIRRLENELTETGDPVIEASLRSAAPRRPGCARRSPRPRHSRTSRTIRRVVELGDTVTVREDGSNELEHFTVVGELEARLVLTWISVNSPPGTALLDSRPGQTVDVETPDGPMQTRC